MILPVLTRCLGSCCMQYISSSAGEAVSPILDDDDTVPMLVTGEGIFPGDRRG